jgi:two-component system nitrate/nitrite response regulator NarL
MSNEYSAIRIVIADEQPALRQDLRVCLETDSDIRVLGEASDANGTADLVRRMKPDILLVDLGLSRDPKIHPLTNLIGASEVRMVAMVATIQKPVIVEAFLLGAQGIVLKASAPRVLLKSIRSVMAGHYWLEHDSLGILLEALREVLSRDNSASSRKEYGLTRRELDIITKIVSGRSNREVGEEFSISERTVKHHLTNIFGKVGVTSRLQLALFAVNHHLMATHTPALVLQPMQSEKEA